MVPGSEQRSKEGTRILSLFTVRSPFLTTSTMGLSICDVCGSDKYCHISGVYIGRAFDVAPESRVAADVYTRLVNGTITYAQVYARAYRDKGGLCGVDVEVRAPAGTRRLRYYHVQPRTTFPSPPGTDPGAGSWQAIGTMGAFGSGSFLLGTVYTSGPCQPRYKPSRPPFVHVHLDTVYTESGIIGPYDWINCSLSPGGSLSTATDLFHI